ncbi:MAG TPA: ABC transporter substrate-binding protein [Candidatus Limnocylindrales bacterium]|nr:ABC transporter substrate-binding protein [Candidatus Limnocylindrales bacterium]
MGRKRLGALLALAGLVFSACGAGTSPSPSASASSSASASTPASSSASATASAAVKEGGILVVGLDGDMVFADPALISDSNSSYVDNQVVQGLVGLKPGTVSDVIPVLAASLPQVSADGKTYTFTLRTGVKFHDGTDFDAQSVKYNYDRWKNFPKGELQDNDYYYAAVFGGFGADSNIISVDAPDATTVVFTLKQPQSNFTLSQTLSVFGIQSPTALKNGNADSTPLANNKYAQGQLPQGQDMVGTGPFIYKEWVPNDHVTIVKNPDYWDKDGAAHVDQVVFKPFSDQTAKLQALQSGGIDLAQTVSPADLATLKSDPKLAVIDRGESCNAAQISMNQDPDTKDAVSPEQHKLLANKDIRMAIAYAVNKQGYIDAFYGGLAKPADNWMPPATENYKPENLPTYDPDKAKQLIQQSGETNLTIDLFYPSDVVRPYMPDPKGLAQAIAQDLEAVGFTINLKSEGWRTGYLADEEVGKFPMWILGWTCDWAGADNFLYTAFFHLTGNTQPEFGYVNQDLNNEMLAALAATTDADAQTHWQKAQDILAQDMPTVPLVNSTPPGAMQAYVKGFQGAGNLTELFNTVWLDK